VIKVEVTQGVVDAVLAGPKNTYVKVDEGEPTPDAEQPFRVYVDRDSDAAVLELNGERSVLKVGEWTDWVAVNFTMVPGVVAVNGMVRFLLKSVRPCLRCMFRRSTSIRATRQ